MNKIAVALAFFALVNAAVDDVVPEQALVTTHLETDPAVENSPEYEFLNDAAFVQEVSEASTLDIDKLLKEQLDEARKNLRKLNAEKPAQKAKKKAAREKFHSGRKDLRKNFKSCKKTITKKDPTLNSPKCAIFRTELMALEVEATHGKLRSKPGVLGEQLVLADAMVEVGKRRRRASPARRRRTKRKKKKAKRKAKRAKKKAKRKQKKQKRKAKKKQKKQKKKQKRNLKRDLRKIRRKRRRELRATWRKAKKAYKDFKKSLRGARFQVKVLPKIFKIMEPEIDKAMAEMNIRNDAGKQGGDVVKKTPDKAIIVQTVLRKFVDMSLHKVIDPLLQKVFDTVEGLIWGTMDPVMASIKSSLVGSVGSIPFIGGFLASLVGAIIDKVYNVLKNAVNNALNELRTLLQNKIVGSIVNACFKKNHFERNVSGATRAGDAASNAVAQTSSTQYKKAEVAAKPAAKRAENDVVIEAKTDGQSMEKTEAEDKAVDDKENKDDDKDEEEEEEDEL